MNNKISIEMRLNNTLFQCKLDQKYYNLKDKKSYAVAFANGVLPTAQGSFQINIEAMVICEDCWTLHKGNTEGLQLEEPSPIVTAAPNALSQLKKSPGRN